MKSLKKKFSSNYETLDEKINIICVISKCNIANTSKSFDNKTMSEMFCTSTVSV